jgi:L-cysteine desulfidase
MEQKKEIYSAYTEILKEELMAAMGCTEPIALAYAAAIARRELSDLPDKVLVQTSGSIIKNVKSVIVPNTGHLKGIPAAVSAGIVAGNPDKELEVIADVSKDDIKNIEKFMQEKEIVVEHLDEGIIFDIVITLYKGEDYAKVHIINSHTNVVLVEHNHQILKSSDCLNDMPSDTVKYEFLNMKDIWDYINHVELVDIKDILDRQIAYNMAIAEEGLQADYGANIGKVILSSDANSLKARAAAMAAAGSDARMNGCELPVIINSGSGNQGITVSVPVITYAKELKATDEQLYRALALSNLTAIHQRTPIGRLSAYCGAVNAGAAAGAGIAYLSGGDYEAVIHTVVNALAIVSGIICDGAKASCAGKIAFAVEAGILGYNMYMQGQQFYGGDGIVKKGIEDTLKSVGRLGKDGMKGTNEEIIKIMLE